MAKETYAQRVLRERMERVPQSQEELKLDDLTLARALRALNKEEEEEAWIGKERGKHDPEIAAMGKACEQMRIVFKENPGWDGLIDWENILGLPHDRRDRPYTEFRDMWGHNSRRIGLHFDWMV
jgi:hypothetical protein